MGEFEGLFWEIHSGHTQEGPGNDESTLRALSLIRNLPGKPAILDVGCGPGRQTLALARNTGGKVIALDTHLAFLDDVGRKAESEKLADRITVINRSMADMNFDNNSFDIIWSEGAIYIFGFQKGLLEWKRFLRPGGAMAATELSLLGDDTPVELRDYWKREYPAVKTVRQNIKIIEDAGYTLIDNFVLPDSAWWDYYRPIEKRLEELRAKYADDRKALEYFDEAEEEIDIFRKYSKFYGYVFYVMTKPQE